MAPVALALFGVNALAYPLLWGLTLLRLVRHPGSVVRDLSDHGRGVGFFTAVAATGVLGVQCLVVLHWSDAATVLFALGILLWAVLTYAVFTAYTVRKDKPSLAEGLNGGWLVAVVATESIANLGGLLAAFFPSGRDELLFTCLGFWLFGAMLYVWIISLIFYRYTFFRLLPSDLTPSYWINMGAAAISTLAGTTLIDNASRSPLLSRMLPFLFGFTVLLWATATWWIPLLVILTIWRHVIKRFEVAYDPLHWSAVFPLGMYTVATLQLAQVLEIPFLLVIPRVFVFAALIAWAAAFTGLLRSLARGLSLRSNDATA
jgi:tellurite resistance protein TehA-like permease